MLKITFEFTEDNLPASTVMAALDEAVGAIDIHSVDLRAEKHVGDITSVEGPQRVIGKFVIENRQLPKDENIVTDVNIALRSDGHYGVTLTKAFAEEHGGGTQTFALGGYRQIHRAVDAAREGVTVSVAQRTDLPKSVVD